MTRCSTCCPPSPRGAWVRPAAWAVSCSQPAQRYILLRRWWSGRFRIRKAFLHRSGYPLVMVVVKLGIRTWTILVGTEIILKNVSIKKKNLLYQLSPFLISHYSTTGQSRIFLSCWIRPDPDPRHWFSNLPQGKNIVCACRVCDTPCPTPESWCTSPAGRRPVRPLTFLFR